MAQRVAMGGEVLDQRGTIGRPALGIAERIDLEHRALGHAERDQDVPAAGDHLGIGQRFGRAQHLDPDLVELPVAALLRAFVAEHRARVEDLARQVRLREPVRDQRAADPRRHLGAERDGIPAPVGEGIHLLHHDVRGIAEAAGEDTGILEDRRRPFLEAIQGAHAPRGLRHGVVAAELLADQVARAADGLQGCHPKVQS